MSVFLQLCVRALPRSYLLSPNKLCLPLPTNVQQRYVHEGRHGDGFWLHRCKTLSYVLYYSWIVWGKGGICWSSQAPIAPAACNPAKDLLGCTLKSFIWAISVPLYQGDVTRQYLNFGNTAVLLTSTWARFILGGADTADHVAAWSSGDSLVRRGRGSGGALWAVARDPVLVGEQNYHARSYPVFRAHEADGPSR